MPTDKMFTQNGKLSCFAFTPNRMLAVIATVCGSILFLSLLLHGTLQSLGENSYGILAQALIEGRLDVSTCPEGDCAVFENRLYIIFPPFPALVAMPCVLLFGPAFKGFVLVATVMAAVTLLLWKNILSTLEVDKRDQTWLIAALAFASPVFGVTFYSDGVWFFAQSVGLLTTTLSLWAVICRRSLVTAAVFLGCAFLCRQMSIFWYPALIVLSFPAEERWLRPSRRIFVSSATATLVLTCFVAVYCLYNGARFGDPLETGYSLMVNNYSDYLTRRVAQIGIFSPQYVLQNFLYLLVQGVHVDFSGYYFTKVQGLDPLGTSLLAASPWIILAAYLKLDRISIVLLLVISFIAGMTLFYHANGYVQTGMQRFTLDWLPLLLVLMARTPRPIVYSALPVLVVWSITLTTITHVLRLLYGVTKMA